MPQITENAPKKTAKRLSWKLIISAAVPVLLIVLYAIFAASKARADFAVKYFSAPAKRALGTIFSVFPFSVMELMYIAIGVLAIVFIVLSIRKIIRSRGSRVRTALKRVCVLVIAVLYIITGYFWLWGINYQGSSFSEKSGFYSSGTTTEDLIAVTKVFLANANRLSDSVARDENACFAESLDSVFSAYGVIYDSIEEEFPVLSETSLRPKRMYIFSEIMSIMGFTGVYFPFSGESNININMPRASLPATIAHELAHQRGVYSEAEANFVGIMASVTSGNVAYEYSGWYSGLTHLMNALYKADLDAWRELRAQFSEGLNADWKYSNEYWAKYESQVSVTSAAVYDTYLKAQGQTDGIKSYGACVNLLVEYFK